MGRLAEKVVSMDQAGDRGPGQQSSRGVGVPEGRRASASRGDEWTRRPPPAGAQFSPWAAWQQFLNSFASTAERERELGQRVARVLPPPAEQARAFTQFVAGFAPPGEELAKILERVRSQRQQLDSIRERLDSIEATVVRYAALVEAIENRQRAFSEMFLPAAWRSRSAGDS